MKTTCALFLAFLFVICGESRALDKNPSAYTLGVTADHADAIYRRGEQVTFTISVSLNGKPVDDAKVKWTISKDGKPPEQSGEAKLQNGSAVVTGKLDEPGFLQCRADITPPGEKTKTVRAGAAIDAPQIEPSLPAPDDFDAFWAAEKAKLAAIPLNVRMTPVKSPVPGVECFDVQADGFGGPLSAYLARPTGAKAKSLPAIVLTHGAGVAASRLSVAANWAKDGLLALDFNAHGLTNDQPKEFYAQLYRGELKDYFWKNRDSRENIFFHELYLRLQRAMDVVTAQPEWDGVRLIVNGRSQGGGQAIVAGGLDPRVTMICAQIPAFCDHTGIVIGRINGWPRLIPNDAAPPDDKVVQTARYYDAVNFAARTHARAFFTVGFIDITCPPTGVYAAYNQLRGPKKILHNIHTGHVGTKEGDDAVRDQVLEYLHGKDASAPAILQNDRYSLEAAADGAVMLSVAGMPPQKLAPEFTVLWSETDPLCTRNASHPNYPVAPRTAVRWRNSDEPLDSLNAWIGSAEFRSATALSGSVRAEGKKRVWEFRDASGKTKVRVTGEHALDTTRPFNVGHREIMRPLRSAVESNRVIWEFAPQAEFALSAELTLPSGGGDPELSFTLTPRRAAFFSVAFTGAPDALIAETLPVPQECDARGHKQFDFVMSEADLHLPRAHVATASGNVALIADPRECRFRLPTIADSRFGFMLASEAGRLKPVLLAPLLGGPESRMRADEPWRFTFRCVVRTGDWKETYAHIARDIHGFRDQRDNSGAGSLNTTLERVMDFLADRRGGNHALWDAQQKYYDYFTDKTGVFKPFSPLYGLSAAIVTDDEEFFRTRARPAVEYALSRRTSVFAPYDNADNKQANSAGREVGAPYIGYAQLVSLHELFQRRTPALRALAEAKGAAKGRISDALARWRLTEETAALDDARTLGAKALGKHAAFSEEELFDLLDLAEATHDPQEMRAVLEAAYQAAAKLNLYPVPPDSSVTVEHGGLVPVHAHSFGRHKNQWGFPPPEPLRAPEQTVPAWRIARLGLPGIAYPIEYWMNTHGAMMRAAGLAHDDFLRDIARWGMVGRFGNYPGDNRSQDSLVPELPDAVERMPWDWNFATVNPGHAWDFAGALLDFLVSDAFERSHGAIDFPAESAAGSNFRVRIYGAKPGRFFGDENVRLWLPRGLVTSDNRQLDWLAGYGNGNVYLALLNQSFREEHATIVLDGSLAQCDPARDTRVWRDNTPAAPLRSAGNRLTVTIAPKGIIALAIPATVKPRLQAKLYDTASVPLPAASFAEASAPFGKVHAMLLRAGRGLTSAFVYAESLPENVIVARLHWRQGDGPRQTQEDDIYPYEFSPELRDDAGDFECAFEVEDAQQQLLRSPVLTLAMGDHRHAGAAPSVLSAKETSRLLPVGSAGKTPSARTFGTAAVPIDYAVGATSPLFTVDFIAYLQCAANGNEFGLRADNRFYPYSTPQGRRIAWRQIVWDEGLFARGCTREEAEQRLRADLSRNLDQLKNALAARQPPVNFAGLEQRQQETLLDFAQSESVAGMKPELVSAVLARDWPPLINDHLYVRYAGHAPDHPRNRAFAARWIHPDP